MNARFPNSKTLLVLALVVVLPLAVAGCGNSGPLVMPDTVPAKTAPADADADADGQTVDTVEPDEVEAPVADPIPDVELDDDVDADDGND